MSEKVKVNKAVGEILYNVKEDNKGVSTEHKLFKLLWFIYAGDTSIRNWLEINRLEIVDILDAFEIGWEVEYQFKEGDIVSYENETTGHLTVDYVIGVSENSKWVIKLNNNQHHKWLDTYRVNLNLVCKAKDREDLE
jgi:hypothetical protein